MDLNLVEVKLKIDERVIKETLTRIGIVNKKEKILYPTCYLINQDDKYYIVHFKQLFLLENENSYNNISSDDYVRRNAIIKCLLDWNLIEIDDINIIKPYDMFVYVLSSKDKNSWQIKHKYNINKFEYYQLVKNDGNK